MTLNEIGAAAKQASVLMNRMTVTEKNKGLSAVAKALTAKTEYILAANDQDIEEAKKNHMSEALLDRLRLTEDRIGGMAEGIRQVVALTDPVGEVISMKTTPSGLQIGQKRVPMGVIGIIYESRPNVTADAFALCFKTGNAVILRGGSDAIHSNLAICNVIREALDAVGLPADAIQVLEDTSRETAQEFMRLNQYMDLLIPRGGEGLIRTVVEKSTVPVIETGTGNCHVYVDESADFEKALQIIENAKTSRPSVCNAEEVLLVHSAVAEKFLPLLQKKLVEERKEKGEIPVELRLCDRAAKIISGTLAGADDFDTEFLDYILAVKIVDSVEEAVEHISKHSTGHSEAIITESKEAADYFTMRVDSAAVYVNVSTRFTDGGEFGLGCEMGISTQKLHARGPMGLEELCTYKYIIRGEGQIR